MSRYLQNADINESYGEIATSVSLDYPATFAKGNVGRLADGICVKIIDELDKHCGSNFDGEICIKVEYKFVGYFEDQRTTEAIFDEEGFFKTGDISRFDDDGNLYVVDRKKDIIKCHLSSNKVRFISPSSMEAYLVESSEIKMASNSRYLRFTSCCYCSHRKIKN